MSSHYFKPLIPDHFYHILNRGNDKTILFYTKENYNYFLKQYDSYLSEYLTTYAFCLLSNHFHLLVKLNTEREIIETAQNLSISGNLALFLPDLTKIPKGPPMVLKGNQGNVKNAIFDVGAPMNYVENRYRPSILNELEVSIPQQKSFLIHNI